jgi:UDP-GlcNAc:undecaprenyl-phosphate GlcNAc-1-phosphate transferase
LPRFHEYIIIFGVAAVVTWLATFAVRSLARRHSLLVMPDDTRVHEKPTPTGGGTAMYLGMLAAIAVASQLPAFADVFKGSSAPMGVVLAATVIFAVGLTDDMREMSPPAKLAGQVLAAMVLYTFGVNMLFFHVPLAETTLVLSADWAVLGTVLWVAVMANSVNFIDGLDGLAAGIVGIGALAFFVYAHQLGVAEDITSNNAGPLIAIVTVGVCAGFLPHNFHPAKIFMGDAGAMLLGLLLASCTLAVVGQDPYNNYSGKTYFFFAPIIIPFFILGIPILDTAFAVVRRAGKRSSPAVRDLNHLHHRLMRLGHGHRQAVVVLWAWTALLSSLVLWPAVTKSNSEIGTIGVAALSILLYTLFAPRGRTPVAADRSPVPKANGLEADSAAPRNGPGPLPRALPAGGRTAANGAARNPETRVGSRGAPVAPTGEVAPIGPPHPVGPPAPNGPAAPTGDVAPSAPAAVPPARQAR